MGHCSSCGDKTDAQFRSFEFDTAGVLENKDWCDPHVVVSNEKSQKATDLTKSGSFLMDRPWFYLLKSMIESSLPDHVRILIVGFATDKAKNIDAWQRVWTGNIEQIVHPETGSILDIWGKACGQAIGKTSRSRSLSKAHGNSIRPDIEHRVSAQIPSLLRDGEPAWQEAAKQYEPLMEALSGALAPGNTVKSLEKRQYISSLKPQVQLKKKQEEGKS
jgi:hypothetical protein